MNNILVSKYQKLCNILSELKRVVVAYSGGVDSALLAYIASQVLGEHALAVTTFSPSLSEEELNDAKVIAKMLGFQHLLLESHEFEDPRYLENTSLRCFWCKQEKFGLLCEYVKQHQFNHVIDGTNADDRNDHRPGREAAKQLKIRSPLLEAGISKKEVRALAGHFAIPNWNKPANSCLSTRIPTGIPINQNTLQKIAAAESFIKKFNIDIVRVRCHGELARIEIAPKYFQTLLSNRQTILSEFRALGFLFITLDLLGYPIHL